MAILQRTFPFVLSAVLLLGSLFTNPSLFAEGTRTWEQSRFEDLSKGTFQGVAISKRGGIELAPSFQALSTTPATYIWAIAADNDGAVYAATGAPARIYRITPDGHAMAIFQPAELQVQSLVVTQQGVIYAATNPDGKVYRLERSTAAATAETSAILTTTSGWNASVYFEPHTKYIWKLALDSAGNVYVATGDRGQIFRVTPKAEHSLFFKSDEAQIRTMEFDLRGNLIAGSDGSGLIYRISPSGDGFVLYSAPKKEITALALDADGNIYAAGVGDKRSNSSASAPSSSVEAPPASPSSATTQPSAGISVGSSSASPTPAVSNFSGPSISAPGGSEIYKIASDGSPTRLWSSRDDIVYALAFDQQGRLLAGTGNRGRIFAIAGEDDYTELLRTSATQVTAFAKAPTAGLIAATSNLGKVFVMGANSETVGTYESDVFDARIFSRWGRAEIRDAGNVGLFVRSGNVDNPDRDWSAWKRVDTQKENGIVAPSARFVQWKAVLHSGNPQPRLNSVTLNYLPKNVAPDFDDVTVQAGIRYQSASKSSLSDTGGNQPQRFDNSPSGTHDRDSIGVRWSVHDDNDDQMVYSVYYRGDGESRWLLLKSDLSDKFFSFDAALLPDGGYTIRVVASDAPSHPSSEALSAKRESARFEVDTTPPRIEDLKGSADKSEIHITFRASDSFSPIKRAEYSVDAGNWQFLEPVGQLSDSRNESYDLRTSMVREPLTKTSSAAPDAIHAESSEHIVVLRIYDRYDNMSSAKLVVHGR